MIKDLLTQKLRFNVIQPQTKHVNIFQLVIEGKVTALSKMLSEFETVNVIVNSKDPEGKTPLFYACYFNYQNIVMYLLMKGADPFLISQHGINVFHVCAYRGHLECIQIIYHMLRHKLNKEKITQLKQIMRQFRFKKTDVHHGQLVCSDKHLKQTQQRFAQFQQEVSQIYQGYLDQLLLYLNKAVTLPDELMKNPVHYASLSQYTKSLQCTKFLLLYTLSIPGWEFFYDMFMEVQLLEQSSEKKEDPRQYMHFNELARNFLEDFHLDKATYAFLNQVKKIQKDVANHQDNEGYSPMHIASFAGDFAAIQFILSVGGDPKLKCRKKQQDVLDYASNDQVRKYLMDLKNAAKQGDQKAFDLLVNCGQLVNGKATIYGIAPVHNAIAYTHKSHTQNMLNQILDLQADVNVTDTNGWTPLHHAAQYGELEAIKSLISRKANVNILSNKGLFPIHVAALNNQARAVRLLIENGADSNSVDDQKCTPLHLAAKKGFPDVVQILFDSDANIYQVDNRFWTALHYASFYMHKNVVHQLCRFDADEDRLRMMRTTKGQLAKDMMTNSDVKFAFETLWNAARDGQLDIVRKLVTLGHDINEQTYIHKFTPLILATRSNHFLVVKYLLSEGADRGISDKYGNTALDYAKKQKNPKLQELLQLI